MTQLSRFWLLLFFLTVIFLNDVIDSASTHDSVQVRKYSSDVEEITRSLLAHRDDPMAREDKWASLSDSQRQAWTRANNVIPQFQRASDLLEWTGQLRNSVISIHVDVQIVAPEHLNSQNRLDRVLRYSTAMRAGCNGTQLNFTVSVAPKQIYQRMEMHSLTKKIGDFTAFLDQSSYALGTLNVLYIILYSREAPVFQYAAETPVLGYSRTAFFFYPIDNFSHVPATALLTTTEKISEHIFAPKPLYFPLPLIPRLEVSVTAYTPGHEHRAMWLDAFVWEDFETAVRRFALNGQKLRFTSAQSNPECAKCRHAFRNIMRPPSTFIRDAIVSLTNESMLGHTWADGFVHHFTRKRTSFFTFRLYVVDTVNIRQSDALQRLERRVLFAFPGIAILVIRSSDPGVTSILHSAMLRAVVASVYGITDPATYIQPPKPSKHNTGWPSRPSPVLYDIMTRNIVRSVVEHRIGELEEIIDGMVYFEVDPAEALDEHAYALFLQRVNYMLFKLKKAQQVASETHDGEFALYLVSSSAHDIKSIRNIFDIYDDKQTPQRFKDPTIRCHFSRLKREALRASKIIETTYPSLRPALLSLVSFFLSAFLTRAVLLRMSLRKSSSKLE